MPSSVPRMSRRSNGRAKHALTMSELKPARARGSRVSKPTQETEEGWREGGCIVNLSSLNSYFHVEVVRMAVGGRGRI